MNKKRSHREEVYAEYDEEFATWAIFGLNSGFCYVQPSTKQEAEQLAEEWNTNGGRVPGKKREYEQER